MKEEKEFNIGDILTITTGRLIAEQGIGAVYGLLNFMTGDNLFTHQLPRAAKICSPELLLQFPQFDTPEFHLEVGKLLLMLESDEADKKHLIAGWLLKQKAKYGETFAIVPLEGIDWNKRNPLDELVDMVGQDKVISVQVD